MKYLFLISLSFVFSCVGNFASPNTLEDTLAPEVETLNIEIMQETFTKVSDVFLIEENVVSPDEESTIEETEVLPLYPAGPHNLEAFKIIPNMSFFDPWENKIIMSLYNDVPTLPFE